MRAGGLPRARSGEPLFSVRMVEAIPRRETRVTAETTHVFGREAEVADGRSTRGRTAKLNHDPAKRPPKVKGRVANDVYPNPIRSATMPPPTTDTQEPMMSRKAKAPMPPAKRTKKPSMK